MKQLIIYFLTLSFFSCQESFQPEKFNGMWLPSYNDKNYKPYYPYVNFTNDSIYFFDVYEFGKVGLFNIDKDSIFIQFKNYSTVKYINFDKRDSTLIIDSTPYLFYENYYEDYKPFHYDLIGLQMSKKLKSDTLSKFESGFHLIKTKYDSLRVKLNDRLELLNRIPEFVSNSHSHPELWGVVVYISDKITLKELILCYYELARSNQLKVILVTNFNLEKNEYDILIEKIDIWNKQLNQHFKGEETTHRFDLNNKNYYITKFSPESITIKSRSDFNNLDKIENNKNYIISIDNRLHLKDYFQLKERLLEIRKQKKIKIRTEFIEVPPNS